MGERILIAEGDDGLREALAARLREEGATVFSASDVDTAIGIIGSNEVDVTLIGLPGFEKEGLRLLKACKSADQPSQAILLVGKHQGALAITGMKLGAFRDVQTPIHFEALRGIIKDAYKARKKNKKKLKRRLIGAAPRIFAAITFAEHGEFETAKKMQEPDIKNHETDNKS